MIDGSGFNGGVLLHWLCRSRLSALTARLLPVSALQEMPLDAKPPSISESLTETPAVEKAAQPLWCFVHLIRETKVLTGQSFPDCSYADMDKKTKHKKEIKKKKRNKSKCKAKQKVELMLVVALRDSYTCHLH